VRRCDLRGSEESLAEALKDIDIVISCVGPAEQQDQIPLAKAAKKAGVKRFVPCGFITVAPPGGIMWLRDEVSLTILTVFFIFEEVLTCGSALSRKRLFTITSNNSGFRTPLSMLVGGTSFRTLDSSPDE
jgi:hypothetical protein